MNVPQPPSCIECGSDPIFHSVTYYSILIDDTLRKTLDPGFVGRIFSKLTQPIERLLGPAFMRLFLWLGWAKKVEEPDEGTQLLALMLWQEAKTRGIEVFEFRLFDLPRNLFHARLPSGRSITYEGIPMPPSVIHRKPWLDDKAQMKKEFAKIGIPVAGGGSASTLRGARKIASQLVPPVITKPYSGSGSRHTILHINTEEELARGFEIAKQICPAVVVEEELSGGVYRATVVNGRLAATIRRDQPYVIGDGIRTISELIEEANMHPKRQGPYFHRIEVTDEVHKELAWQNMTLSSVPEHGQRVQLHQKINWSVGGTTKDVSDGVHPDNAELFEYIAYVLKAPIVGIDFIIEDISRSWKEQERCGVIECNSMPFFDNHHLPFEGEPRNVAKLIWDMVEETQ